MVRRKVIVTLTFKKKLCVLILAFRSKLSCSLKTFVKNAVRSFEKSEIYFRRRTCVLVAVRLFRIAVMICASPGHVIVT